MKIHSYPPLPIPDGDDVLVADDTSDSYATSSLTLTKLKEWLQTLVGWVTPFMWTNPYCFSAWGSGTTSLTDNTPVKILLATELWDFNNNFASSSYTCPRDGIYHFDGRWQMGTIASGVLMAAYVYKNGVLYKESNAVGAVTLGGPSVSADVQCVAGDVIDFYGYQDSAGAEGTQTIAASTWFNGHLVAPL